MPSSLFILSRDRIIGKKGIIAHPSWKGRSGQIFRSGRKLTGSGSRSYLDPGIIMGLDTFFLYDLKSNLILLRFGF